MTPVPRPSVVRPARKGKAQDRRRPAGTPRARRFPPCAAGRKGDCAVTSGSRDLRGVSAEEAAPEAQPRGSKVFVRKVPARRRELRRAKRAADTPHSGHRDLRGALCTSFPPSSCVQRGGGRSRRKALYLYVTSVEPSGDNGNMALNGAEVEDFPWEPPSEAETKVLQARRERQDRISALMGDYLLRGYRMLGETCADCGTILLQNKQRQVYCVACQELDSDVDKDNPALNAQAALSQAREHQLASSLELPAGSQTTPQPPVPRPEHCEGAAAGLKAAQGSAPPAVPPNADVMASTQEALLQKLTWASAELGSSASLETSIQLCSLIRACAEALHSLQQLQH